MVSPTRSLQGPVGRMLMVGLVTLGAAACGGGDTSSAPQEQATGEDPTTAGTGVVADTATSTDAGAQAVELVSFGDGGQPSAWVPVNDPVMGGRSTSALVADDEGLVFSGTVSLENNGGFASARGPEDPTLGELAADAEQIRVRARGDGKTYVLQLRVAGQQWSYIQRFTTEPGAVRDYDLPVAGFEAVDFFLEPAPQAPQRLDPSSVSQIAIYILDKQEGPFAITLVGIDAVG